MKYIKIKNIGLIDTKALHLIGASSKRNDKTKIGQFGSGNKYAIAYLLRNNYELKIYAGLNEIKLHTEIEKFRGNEFNVIYINNEKTSITTEMGKDWKFWQAIREIYCNALDEGYSGLDFVQEIKPTEDETHFYIDTSQDVMEFIGNFDKYFATKKKVIFESKYGRILAKTGDDCNIYRKGIRCFESNMTSCFDYDFNNIEIDENRLVKYSWRVEEKIWKLIYSCTDKQTIKTILHKVGSSNFIEGALNDWSSNDSSEISKEFIEVLKETNLAPKGYAGLLKPDEVHNHVILPTKIFESIRGVLDDENVADKFKVTKKGSMFKIDEDVDELTTYTIKKALDFLRECKFDIPYEIKVARFDDPNIYGTVYGEIILLSDIGIEKGINEVVNTIIEEYIHIKYKVRDETRGFQTSVISEFINYMKIINVLGI